MIAPWMVVVMITRFSIAPVRQEVRDATRPHLSRDYTS